MPDARPQANPGAPDPCTNSQHVDDVLRNSNIFMTRTTCCAQGVENDVRFHAKVDLLPRDHTGSVLITLSLTRFAYCVNDSASDLSKSVARTDARPLSLFLTRAKLWMRSVKILREEPRSTATSFGKQVK
ncbi:unnamed protein product [Cercospora beticola]|nr:unnamed protein product [Cercospora beticola]